jgi:excisionase family DNA binding protein
MVKTATKRGRTPMVLMEKTVLTVSEAAAMLNAHPNSVRRWADLGLLPSFRIGLRGDRRFRVEDIAFLVDSWKRSDIPAEIAG